MRGRRTLGQGSIYRYGDQWRALLKWTGPDGKVSPDRSDVAPRQRQKPHWRSFAVSVMPASPRTQLRPLTCCSPDGSQPMKAISLAPPWFSTSGPQGISPRGWALSGSNGSPRRWSIASWINSQSPVCHLVHVASSESYSPKRDYDSNYDEEVELHDEQRFEVLYKSPTPTS